MLLTPLLLLLLLGWIAPAGKMLLDFGKISFSPVTSQVRTLKRAVRLLTFSVRVYECFKHCWDKTCFIFFTLISQEPSLLQIVPYNSFLFFFFSFSVGLRLIRQRSQCRDSVSPAKLPLSLTCLGATYCTSSTNWNSSLT